MFAIPERVTRAPQNALFRLASYAPTRVSLRIGFPATAAILSLIVVDLAAGVLPGGGAFLILLLPVLAASIALGFGAGLLTIALCGAGVWLLVPLRAHPWLSEPTDIVRMALFLIEGTLLAAVATGLRAVSANALPGLRAVDASTVDPLTTREIEVLGLAAAGLTTEQIASRLFVSRNTVKSHLAHGYGKLGARNRAEAVAAALKGGLIELGESSG